MVRLPVLRRHAIGRAVRPAGAAFEATAAGRLFSGMNWRSQLNPMLILCDGTFWLAWCTKHGPRPVGSHW